MTVLRRAEPDDEAFLRELDASLRRERFTGPGWENEATQAILEQQYDLRRRDRAARFADAIEYVVLADGRPVGAMLIARTADALHVVDLAIAPAQRGRGLGTLVLREVLGRADAELLPVAIDVDVVNAGARRLYERLGFVATEDDGVTMRLVREPAAASFQRLTADRATDSVGS